MSDQAPQEDLEDLYENAPCGYLSLGPDVIADAAPSTKMLLMVTHLVAAAIVIPAIARRLPA